MAAATMAIAGGVSAAGGLYQAISGAEQARNAKRELESLRTPELNNIGDGLTVSRLGADLQAETGARNTATTVDAIQSGGARTIIGGLPGVVSAENDRNRTISADLDRQKRENDMIIANDKAEIRAIKERRYNNDVAALSSQINAGNENLMQGLQSTGQGVVSGIQGYTSQKNLEKYGTTGWQFDPVTGKPIG